MRTVAYITDFIRPKEQEMSWCEKIRENTKADRILAVISSDYIQNGIPARETVEERRAKALECGVDFVLEMSLFASLSSIGIYAYSIARVLDKMKTVDGVLLEVHKADLSMLDEISMFLVKNPKEFQQKITTYKKENRTFYQAQAKALEEYIPGAEKVMGEPYHIFAVELMTALKYMYSSIDIQLMEREEEQLEDTCFTSLEKFDEYLKFELLRCEDEQLADIYGGNDILTKNIREHEKAYENLKQFATLIAGTHLEVYDVRKYFLNLILGITKNTISIWRMYDFAPYSKVSCAKDRIEELLERKKQSHVLLLSGDEKKETLDRSVQRLLQIEERAVGICNLERK